MYMRKSAVVSWSFRQNDQTTSHQGGCYMINLIREQLDGFIETQPGRNNWFAYCGR